MVSEGLRGEGHQVCRDPSPPVSEGSAVRLLIRRGG